MMRHEMVRPRSLFETLMNEDFLTPVNYGENIDIYKVDEVYHVDLEIPGFSKEDISVEFKDDVLSIHANVKEETDKQEGNYFYRSRKHESIERKIRFADVDGEAVDARYENGVLYVSLPKVTKVESVNRIEVK